jgi:hypothetical protein
LETLVTGRESGSAPALFEQREMEHRSDQWAVLVQDLVRLAFVRNDIDARVPLPVDFTPPFKIIADEVAVYCPAPRIFTVAGRIVQAKAH